MLKRIPVLTFILGVTFVLVLSGFANGDLPPRPTPMPTPVSTETVVSLPAGSQIQLHIENEIDEIPPQLWTVVEWQDTTTGDWHVVEGWRGTLDAPTSQTWWVGVEQFGTGPFRWQVYANESGTLLATSAPFNLPTHAGVLVVVNVTLK